MNKNILILLIFFSVFAKTVSAQEFHAELDLNIGAPQGEFKENVDQLGWGFGLMGGYKFEYSPILIGLDMGFMNFGSDLREEPLSSTIPDLRVEVRNSYNLFHGDLLLRMMGPPSMLRPYVDGLVGFNYFFTQTTLEERGSVSGEHVMSDTNFDDFTFSYGLGAGLNLRVYQYAGFQDERGTASPTALYLNGSVRYMFGRSAEYMRKGSVQVEDGEVFYDVLESATNLLYFKIGVVFQF
ncbi:MAG TPA: outer membrane beta-barrel protein [Balneolaceae bacterium]|nr:outer membrane beta-barrel protein [Balneolaceae bacterium]